MQGNRHAFREKERERKRELERELERAATATAVLSNPCFPGNPTMKRVRLTTEMVMLEMVGEILPYGKDLLEKVENGGIWQRNEAWHVAWHLAWQRHEAWHGISVCVPVCMAEA